MALSRSSVLHYSSSRYGVIPVVGGSPHHSRNTAGMTADARGQLYSAIINTPRLTWQTDKSSGDPTKYEQRAALLFEPARTNRTVHSTDLSNAAFYKSGLSIATGIRDPEGGTAACTLTATATNGEIYQYYSALPSSARTASAWLRRRTGSGGVNLPQPDNAANTYPALTSQWRRFGASCAATTVDLWDLVISVIGDAIDVYNAQTEDGAFATSDIVNVGASATTRAADSFYWTFQPPPQGMMIYSRHVECGGITTDGYFLWELSAPGSVNPRLLVFSNVGKYAFYHLPSSGSALASLAVAPSIGDTVETVAILFADGSVQLIQSLNGAAVTSTAQSSAVAMEAAWSAPTAVTLNVGDGANAFLDFRFVKYGDVAASTAQGIMNELRAFELDAPGNVL